MRLPGSKWYAWNTIQWLQQEAKWIIVDNHYSTEILRQA